MNPSFTRKLVGFLFLIGGATTIISTSVEIYDSRNLEKYGVITKGYIIDAIPTGPEPTYIIEYVDSNGEKSKFENNFHTNLYDRFNTGDSVEVIYLPNTDIAYINTKEEIHSNHFGFPIGVIVLIIGIVNVFIIKKKPNA